MNRAPYKLRKVVEEFDKPNSTYPEYPIPMQRLECGHVKYKRRLSSTTEKISAAFKIINKEATVRRCYECAKIKSGES